MTETERVIARKFPQALPDLQRVILASKALIAQDPSPDEVRANLHLISHAADVPIVLAALKGFFGEIERYS